MLRTVVRCAVLSLVSACLWAAQGPGGWKTLKSVTKPPATMAGAVIRDGKCTIAVPQDWIEDNTVDRSQAHSRDGRAQASVQQWPMGPKYPSFANRRDFILSVDRQQLANAKRLDPKASADIRVLENSPTRFKVMRVQGRALLTMGMTDWNLPAAGDPICSATIVVSATDPGDPPELHAAGLHWVPIAEQIAASFTGVK